MAEGRKGKDRGETLAAFREGRNQCNDTSTSKKDKGTSFTTYGASGSVSALIMRKSFKCSDADGASSPVSFAATTFSYTTMAA